jgi:hypothetical protein
MRFHVRLSLISATALASLLLATPRAFAQG